MSEPMDEREVTARVAGILNRWPAAGFALGVVRDGALQSFHGHGYADITSRAPVTEDTVFRIASITKTFTAIAVMQLWEQGLVDLDAPANDYLRAYRLIAVEQGFRPVTVRQLLTHTSGLGELGGLGDLFRPTWGAEVANGPAPPLADRYRGGLRVRTEPGTHFAYADHNFSTLGQIVEDVTGEPLDRYLREHVLAPLGMESTGTSRERSGSRLSTGYVLRSGGLAAVAPREFALGGAGFLHSTTRDMAGYVAALLDAGAGERGPVLRPETLATMFEAHYQPDPRVPGVGLAFFRAEAGGHRLVEHQGILPGFSSQLVAAPDDGIGVIALTNTGSPAPLWLPWEIGDLVRSLLGVPPAAIRTDVPQHPDVWADLCGRYGPPGPIADLRTRAMVTAGADVFVRRGRLMMRVLGPVPTMLKGLRLHPDDPDDPTAFRIDLGRFGLGTIGVLFGRTSAGRTALHLDGIPLTLEKRAGAWTGGRWVAGALAAGAVLAALGRRRSAG